MLLPLASTSSDNDSVRQSRLQLQDPWPLVSANVALTTNESSADISLIDCSIRQLFPPDFAFCSYVYLVECMAVEKEKENFYSPIIVAKTTIQSIKKNDCDIQRLTMIYFMGNS